MALDLPNLWIFEPIGFMKKGQFEFTIHSAYDREKLICEISFQGKFIAEISQELEEPIIEILSGNSFSICKIPLTEFQKALELAKKHLIHDRKK